MGNVFNENDLKISYDNFLDNSNVFEDLRNGKVTTREFLNNFKENGLDYDDFRESFKMCVDYDNNEFLLINNEDKQNLKGNISFFDLPNGSELKEIGLNDYFYENLLDDLRNGYVDNKYVDNNNINIEDLKNESDEIKYRVSKLTNNDDVIRILEKEGFKGWLVENPHYMDYIDNTIYKARDNIKSFNDYVNNENLYSGNTNLELYNKVNFKFNEDGKIEDVLKDGVSFKDNDSGMSKWMSKIVNEEIDKVLDKNIEDSNVIYLDKKSMIDELSMVSNGTLEQVEQLAKNSKFSDVLEEIYILDYEKRFNTNNYVDYMGIIENLHSNNNMGNNLATHIFNKYVKNGIDENDTNIDLFLKNTSLTSEQKEILTNKYNKSNEFYEVKNNDRDKSEALASDVNYLSKTFEDSSMRNIFNMEEQARARIEEIANKLDSNEFDKFIRDNYDGSFTNLLSTLDINKDDKGNILDVKKDGVSFKDNDSLKGNDREI